MQNIVVIGNGESRLKIPNSTYDKYRSYGCNKFILDYDPDYICAVDKPMIDLCMHRLIDTKSTCTLYYPYQDYVFMQSCNIVVRAGVKFEGYSSGALALDMASRYAQEYGLTIYMVGFDFVKTNKVNNVYKDTGNYAKSTDKPVPTDNFIKQVESILCNNDNQGIKYVWVNEINDANSSFNNLVLRKYGVDLLSIDDFIKTEEFNDSRDKEDKEESI